MIILVITVYTPMSPKKHSPTKRMVSLYSLAIEGLSLRERKELLDFCLKRRRLDVRTACQTYPFEHLARLPMRYEGRPFHAILYAGISPSGSCPVYFISSNNLEATLGELDISPPSVYVVLYEM